MDRARQRSWVLAGAIGAAALLLALTAVPSQAGSPGSRADGEVKKKGGEFIGMGVVNNTGVDQTPRVKAKQGEKAVFAFRFRNHESFGGSITVEGCVFEGDELRVRYFSGGEEVTEEVETGTLVFPAVSPNAYTPQVRTEVKVRNGAPDGFSDAECVAGVGSSTMSGSARDEPGWKVKVK